MADDKNNEPVDRREFLVGATGLLAAADMVRNIDR